MSQKFSVNCCEIQLEIFFDNCYTSSMRHLSVVGRSQVYMSLTYYFSDYGIFEHSRPVLAIIVH